MTEPKKLKEASEKYLARQTPRKNGRSHQRKETSQKARVTFQEIDKRLRMLPPEKLPVVYDFISYLLERDLADLGDTTLSDARTTMLASEAVLKRDWERPEEDKAWAHL